MLDVRGLHAWYGKSHILHGVDFSVGEGEIVSLLGRNGVGRSTTIKAIMGDVVREGSVQFKGRQLAGLKPHQIANAGLGYVPENRDIFPTLTVRENLLLGQKSGGALAGSNAKARWSMEDMFELFPRLRERAEIAGGVLSGGEQQMLTIGRALMTNPDLILIDEATEGLAPLVAKDIWTTLGIIRGEGVATVVVDKDFRSLSRIADRMVMLSKGTVVFNGTPAELAQKQDLLEQHLGV